MKSYAIARLLKYKNDVIRALINTAIPPSTNTINYRDLPSVNFRNFRMYFSRLGSHKILKLDDTQPIKSSNAVKQPFVPGQDRLNYR